MNKLDEVVHPESMVNLQHITKKQSSTLTDIVDNRGNRIMSHC